MTIKRLVITLLIAAVLLGSLSIILAADEIDLTTADAEQTYNNALFIQGPVDINSAGTGLIDPFLTVGGGGSQDVTQGYNTVDASAEFDTVTGGDRTKPILLSAIPEVERNGGFYKEFKLDINKAPGGSPFLALNELKLFLTKNLAISGYTPITDTFDSPATLVWNLGDGVILMDYSLESGSGQSDVTFLVPVSMFTTTNDCSYGSSVCDDYLVMWNEFGDYTSDEDYTNNDGFEEWGVVLRPIVRVEKDALASYDRTIDWTIDKSVDPAAHSLFAGLSDTSQYTVTVDKTVTEDNYQVTGTITITNPTGNSIIEEPIDAEILSVTDVIDQGGFSTGAVVDCGVTFPYTLGDQDILVCSYSAEPPDAESGTNEATVDLELPPDVGAGQTEYTATADVLFTANNFGFDSINITDTNGGGWSTPVDAAWNYDREFDCSDNPADYTDGFYTYDHDNTATITETEQSDGASITVNCYAPLVEKTATGGYDERHEWSVEKTVDPPAQSAFAGDTVNFNWTITVTEETTVENFAVSGVITVTNPKPDESMTVALSDVLNDAGATGGVIDGASCNYSAGDLIVTADSFETCDYSSSPVDNSATLNTATATLNDIDFSASSGVSWQANVIRGSATLDDDQKPYIDESVDDGWVGSYADSYTCSSNPGDYTDGQLLNNQVSNTAEVSSEGALQDSDTATTVIDCYAPVLEKTAAGTLNERHEWFVEKSVDPASQSGFAGETVNFNWTLTVTEEITEEGFNVTGVITVTNPNPDSPLTVSLADVLNDSAGTVGVIDGNSCNYAIGQLTIAAGGFKTCDYSAVPIDDSATQNTATATYNDINFTALAGVDWASNPTNDTATLDDDRKPYVNEPVYDGWTESYQDNYTCSSSPGDYTDGKDLNNQVNNTAEVYSGDILQDSDSASTVVDCYSPVVEKTADGSYDERHEWSVEKTVDPLARTGYPGDLLTWTWTITVTEQVFDENYGVTGVITVSNPNPDSSMSVTLTDVLDDTTPGVIDENSCSYSGGTLTIPANGYELCDYSAAPGDDSAIQNTATATLNTIDFTASAGVDWSTNVIRGNAKLTDIQGPLNENLSGGGPYIYTYNDDHTCSSSGDDYGTDGTYGATVENTAYVSTNGQVQDQDSASTTWTCEAGYMSLLKLTAGVVNSAMDWQFKLFVGPDGFDGIQVGQTSSTLGDADGVLDFGGPPLSPEATYTVCELGIPPAYSSDWMVDTNGDDVADTVVNPYNPNADDNPPEDLGNRCFDFGAGTDYPVAVGETLVFEVNNATPGGDPRTPGYWKNWNRCSRGNQDKTADKNGGPAAGWFLLEDLLPQSVGTLSIENCKDGVNILDHREIGNGTSKKQPKRASDAAYKLARNLLAAKLNLAAGAETCTAVTSAVADGDTLLTAISFDGTGKYLRPKDGRQYYDAVELASTLDQYNNGYLCSP